MKAVIHCGGGPAWSAALGVDAWPLLPVGNRPLLEYWFELCAERGIDEVRLVLGHGAEFIEAYAGNGERWGLRVSYSFLREDGDPDRFLRRDPARWRDGLLYVRQPAFPRRLDQPQAWREAATPAHAARDANGLVCLFSAEPEPVAGLCAAVGLPPGYGRPFEELGLTMVPLDGVATYYALNMALVAGEITRYLQPGYLSRDGSYLGYNVVLPASASCQPPLMIGNDSRIGALASVGPNVVLGSHVVVDRQCTLEQCVVLDGTYLGVGLEIRGKIVAGSRVVDPATGGQVEIADPWLLAQLGHGARARDLLRAVVEWPLALLLVAAQALPFLLLYPYLRGCGGRFHQRPARGLQGRELAFPEWRSPPGRGRWADRLFLALGLDCWPRFLLAAVGRLWLCGQSPLTVPEEDEWSKSLAHYHPGAISESDARSADPQPGLRELEARYYAHRHSLGGDLRLLLRVAGRRLLGALTD